MTDKEFVDEIRRGLITIMRALIRRYCMSWYDFLPREVVSVPPLLVHETRIEIDVTERAS